MCPASSATGSNNSRICTNSAPRSSDPKAARRAPPSICEMRAAPRRIVPVSRRAWRWRLQRGAIVPRRLLARARSRRWRRWVTGVRRSWAISLLTWDRSLHQRRYARQHFVDGFRQPVRIHHACRAPECATQVAVHNVAAGLSHGVGAAQEAAGSPWRRRPPPAASRRNRPSITFRRWPAPRAAGRCHPENIKARREEPSPKRLVVARAGAAISRAPVRAAWRRDCHPTPCRPANR